MAEPAQICREDMAIIHVVNKLACLLLTHRFKQTKIFRRTSYIYLRWVVSPSDFNVDAWEAEGQETQKNANH